jgi:RNA polymerase sigma-70 factor (ECF subfamily)
VSQLDDLFLIKQTVSGNSNAFRFLVLRYQRPVFKLLGSLIYDKALVEEIAQESFLSAYKSIARFDPQRGVTFPTWLLTIARNLAFNELAKQKTRRKFAATIAEEDEAEMDSAEEDALQRGRRAAVLQAMSSLPLEFRSAVTLSFLEGFSCREIAAVEGCAEGTVKSRIHRAKKLLRELLMPLLKEDR